MLQAHGRTASIILRHPNELRQRLPMPWMWKASSLANIRCIRFRDAEGSSDSRNRYISKRRLNLCPVGFLAKPIRQLRRLPRSKRGCVATLRLGAESFGFTAVRSYASKLRGLCFPVSFRNTSGPSVKQPLAVLLDNCPAHLA